MKKSLLLATLVGSLALSCIIEPDGVQSSNPEVSELIRHLYSDLGRQYTLTIGTSPRDGGTVRREPNSAVTTYKSGSEVRLTAVPASGYRFVKWSGARSDTTATVTVLMNADLTLTANFEYTVRPQYSLVVNADPNQGGTVTRSPSKAVYTEGDTVTVRASARQDYRFTGWSGALNDTSESVTIVMTSNMVLTANFIEDYLDAYALRIRIEPSGAGTVTRNPDRGVFYAGGAWVDLTAVPSAGYEFDGWSGAASGSANPLRIQMNGERIVTAVFRER